MRQFPSRRRTAKRSVRFLMCQPPAGNRKIRAADAKEVGVGNPAEETCCYPNKENSNESNGFVNGPFSFSLTYALRRDSAASRQETRGCFGWRYSSSAIAPRAWPRPGAA